MVASLIKSTSNQSIADWLGNEADSLLSYEAKVSKSQIHLLGPDWVNRIFAQSDRSPQVLRSLQQLYSTGRLAGTGYLSILSHCRHQQASGLLRTHFRPQNLPKRVQRRCQTLPSYSRRVPI